jgi:hypothetical protein
MDESHYDEFGNYVGPALSDSDAVSGGGCGVVGRGELQVQQQQQHVLDTCTEV